MPIVGLAFTFTGNAERLAGTTSGPQGSLVRPPSESSGIRPSSNASEEMTLGVSSEFARSDIHDAPFVDIAPSDVPCGDEVAQPLRGVRVDLVVVGDHDHPPEDKKTGRQPEHNRQPVRSALEPYSSLSLSAGESSPTALA